MKRFTCGFFLTLTLLAIPCQAQKLLHPRKANCQAAVPSNWSGTVNYSQNPEEGKAFISFARGYVGSDFATVKDAVLDSYKPTKVLENSDQRLWIEYSSAATPTNNFDTHWLVIAAGPGQVCTLSLHFAHAAEPAVRTIAASLIATR